MNAHQIKVYCLIVYTADPKYLICDINYQARSCIGKDKVIKKERKK